MAHKTIFNIVGRSLLLEAALLVLPLGAAYLYDDGGQNAILATMGVALALGALLCALCRSSDSQLRDRDGLLVVSLVWVLLSAVGALPFVINGCIPGFVDAFFETVSGFTTTGASILVEPALLPKSILLWRSLTHWIGGMGILVFVVMLGSSSQNKSLYILRAEMPGPIAGKIVPRAKQSAKYLYLIYIGMTVTEFVLLCLGEMTPYESLIYSMGTAGTGGFALSSAGLGIYSAYSQWVITIFMVLFGVNFNLYFFALIKKSLKIFNNDELKLYIGVFVVSTTAIAINIMSIYHSVSESLRQAAFQTATVISTTGFATADFDKWPSFSKDIILILFFLGACGGSTAGGLKMSRVLILAKTAWAELKRILQPNRSVAVISDGARVPDQVVSSVSRYFIVYMLCFIVTFLLLSAERVDTLTSFTAAAACFNNVGPGLSAVGPAGNYSMFSPLAKILLSVSMLLGRLEIYPVLISLMPSSWAGGKK